MHSRKSDIGIENLRGYVFAVAANVLKEARRKSMVFFDLEERALELSDEITPERIVAGRLDVARLVAAIDALPPRTREIFVAHRNEDMSYSAIAAMLGITVSAVEKHIMAALRQLSATLRSGE